MSVTPPTNATPPPPHHDRRRDESRSRAVSSRHELGAAHAARIRLLVVLVPGSKRSETGPVHVTAVRRADLA